jgi:hypothetical protein
MNELPGVAMKLIVNRMMSRGLRGARHPLLGVLLALSAASTSSGQTPSGIRDWDDGIKYARGQNIVPVFEGWVANPDGTFSLIFGFWNRNWEETVFIPIGPDNRIEPGGPDRGQPTVFTPRRGKNLFEIVVPKDFGNKEVVWTVTTRGKTERAFGALVNQEVLSRRMVMAGGSLSANAAAGNDDVGDEADPNKPPSVTMDSVPPVTVPGPATLVAAVSDDGLGAARGREARAVAVAWSLYRGPTFITFERVGADALSATGGKATTTVRFKAPGTYVLRATATDAGGLAINKDVTVVVK